MNIEQHLIFLNNEDKTSEVEYCQYQSGRYSVRFHGNPRLYLYAYNSIIWLRNPELVNFENLQIMLPQGHILYDYQKILKFEQFFRIIFKNGATRCYHQSELVFVENARKSVRVDCLLNYYSQVAQIAGIQTEHYRCHPKIIGFCNQKFYANQLIILTPDDHDPEVMKSYRTVAGQHARARVNQRQIDEIKHNVLPELKNLVAMDDIGIISPYRDQAQTLAQTVEDSKLEISTVHKFQGKEKEAIIITTVDNEVTNFTDNPNLLNVAISRAKRYLRVVVSDQIQKENSNLNDLLEYMKYQNFEQVEGSVYSVFDLLYKDHQAAREAYLRKNKRVSVYDSENLMYTMIQEVLTQEAYLYLDVVAHVPLKMLIRDRSNLILEDLTYVMNSATHVDFLIYSKLSKKPVLAIEVDGVAFHKAGSKQAERDDRKNRIMENFGIPYMRFKTNGSFERVALNNRLSMIIR